MVSKKGKRQAVLLTKVKRGLNIAIGAFAIRQIYIYIYPSMAVFMGMRKRTKFKYDLTLASAVEICDSVYVNQVSFCFRFGTVKKYLTSVYSCQLCINMGAIRGWKL